MYTVFVYNINVFFFSIRKAKTLKGQTCSIVFYSRDRTSGNIIVPYTISYYKNLLPVKLLVQE